MPGEGGADGGPDRDSAAIAALMLVTQGRFPGRPPASTGTLGSMRMDELVPRARRLWEELARVPVSFAPPGGVNVVVSPRSGLCPVGWVGVVVLGGSAIATAPSESAAAIVRDAWGQLPVSAVVDGDLVRRIPSMGRMLELRRCCRTCLRRDFGRCHPTTW